MLIDESRLEFDAAYREDMRHRCETDLFFLSEIIRPGSFRRDYHQDAIDLYFPKNRNLPIEKQHAIKNRLHLDPRKTRKTTLGRMDKLQWILAFPETVTILNESATHPLAKAISEGIANYFCQYKIVTPIQKLYPELVVNQWPFHGDRETWNTPLKVMHDLDATIAYTSPYSKQSGWHPWVINADDMVETNNSGIHAKDESRRKIVDTFDTNRNTLQGGGYMYLIGTRYHPFDLYGVRLADMDPARWQVLVRESLTVKSGDRLVPGEFPEEDDVTLHFPELPDMDYAGLREMFYANYESFMCFTAGSRVLMADWSEKPIEALEVGDEVVGLVKSGPYGSKMVKTKVVRTFARVTQVVESTMEGERKVQHTPDHRFLRPPNGGEMRYVKLKVGCRAVSVYRPMPKPTADQQRDLDWLGGMLDGEGSLGTVVNAIHQKEEANPEIFKGLTTVLNRLGIRYTMGKTRRVDRFSLLGGRSLLIWLLGNARMMKTKRIHAALWAAKQHSETTGRGGGGSSQPKVTDITPIGERWVYDIETETHNFVCEGFAVHNCQQQNDPKGGNTPTFDDKLYASCEIEAARIPPYSGETFTCWRLPYGASPSTQTVEGVAARIVDGRVYIIDCWQGNWIPSKLAERLIKAHRQHQADAMMILTTPGSDHMLPAIRNEAARRNTGVKIQISYWEENEIVRNQEIKQLEPLMKAGRLCFSTAMTKGNECRRQFVHFGLVEETGIAQCVAQLANLVPVSQMRASLEDEEIEWQQRRRDDSTINWLLDQQGMPRVDEQARRKMAAHQQAMQKTTTYQLPALPGGLDG